VSKEAFARAYHHAGAALRPRAAAAFRPPYVVLHVRQPDANTFDFFSMLPPRFCTGSVVQALLAAGLTIALVSNDAPRALAALPPSPRLRASGGSPYDDAALLLEAEGVVQHSPFYSSFSSAPAMARGLPLINTHDPGPDGGPHWYERRFRRHGPLPAEFHTCQEAELFVEGVLWRVRNRH
jgi:hypothetical protein